MGHNVRLPRRAPPHKARTVGLLAAFRRPGILLLLPVLLALAARVFVAPGWMIETDGGGSITVRVCSDPANPGATLTIPVESAGNHDAAQDQHCPWGALAAAPIVPDTPALPETLARAEPVPAAVPSPGYAPGIASPLPPSTGPPFLA